MLTPHRLLLGPCVAWLWRSIQAQGILLRAASPGDPRREPQGRAPRTALALLPREATGRRHDPEDRRVSVHTCGGPLAECDFHPPPSTWSPPPVVCRIRGTCTGYLKAYDRHMNLVLAEAEEVYVLPGPKPPGPRPVGYNHKRGKRAGKKRCSAASRSKVEGGTKEKGGEAMEEEVGRGEGEDEDEGDGKGRPPARPSSGGGREVAAGGSGSQMVGVVPPEPDLR